MDNDDLCSSKLSCVNSEIDTLSKIRINNISPLNLPDSQCSTLKDCTNKKEGNSSKTFLKESKPHLIPDSDDSFEIFLPTKSSNSNLKTVSANNIPVSKKKTKKTFIKSRSCPYFSSKSVKSYFKPPTKSQEDKDLELALARSLLDVSGPGEYPANAPSAVLEKPITKENSTLKLKKWNGKETKKLGKSLLAQRTLEERQKIITQKIAIILLEEKVHSDSPFPKKDIELTSSVLEGFFDKNCSLWELSKLSVESYISDFYVDALKKFVEPPPSSVFYAHLLNSEGDEPQCQTMKIDDGEMETDENESQSPQIVDMEVNEIYPEDNSFDRTTPTINQSSRTVTPPKKDSFDALTTPKNHSFSSHTPPRNDSLGPVTLVTMSPQSDFKDRLESFRILSDNLYSLYKNPVLSDVNIKLRDSLIPGHKVIFFARCPNFLNSQNYCSSTNMIDLSPYSQKVSLAFLKYIYSGKTDSIFCLLSDEKKELSVFSEKYELTYLKSLLVDDLNMDDFYNQSTCSPPHDSKENSPAVFINIEKPSVEHLEVSSKANNSHFTNAVDTFILNDSSSASPSQNNLASEVQSGSNVPRPFGQFSKPISGTFDQSQNSGSTCQPNTRKRKLDFNKPNDNQTDLDSLDKSSVSPSKKNLSILSEVICIESDSDDACEKPLTKLPSLCHSNGSLENNNQSSANSSDIQILNDPDPIELGDNEHSRKFVFEDNDSNDFIQADSTSSSGLKIEGVICARSESPFLLESSQQGTDSPKSEKSLTIDRPGSPLPLLPDQKSKNIRNIEFRKDTSLEDCFQTSFPSISLIEGRGMKSLHAHGSSTPISSPEVSSPFERGTVTPGESSLIIKDATPRAEYSIMVTPELKEELRKYGLKQNLEPRKARELLRYIYDQIHSGLPEQMVPSNPSTSKEPIEVFPSSPYSTSDEESLSIEENYSPESHDYLLEENIFNQSETEEASCSTYQSNLKSIITNFVKNDVGLYTSVLIFEPILLNKFHKSLKEHGVHCKMSELMDTLDELCLTYRIERSEKANPEKKRKRKRKKDEP